MTATLGDDPAEDVLTIRQSPSLSAIGRCSPLASAAISRTTPVRFELACGNFLVRLTEGSRRGKIRRVPRRKSRRSIPTPRRWEPIAATTPEAVEAPPLPSPAQAIQQPDLAADAPNGELGRLARLIGEHRRISAELDMEIDRLVNADVGWPVIASVLGVSRQAARQRHERRVRAALLAAFGSGASASRSGKPCGG